MSLVSESLIQDLFSCSQRQKANALSHFNTLCSSNLRIIFTVQLFCQLFPPFLIHCTEFNLYYRQNPQQYRCYNAPTHSSTQKGEKVIRLLRGKIALAILQMFLSTYVSSHSFLTWPLFFSHLSIFLFQSKAVPSLM